MDHRSLPLIALFAIGSSSQISNAQDGTLDPTFDGDGLVTTDVIGGSYDDANAVVMELDGKIVAAGTSGYSDEQNFAIARYLPNGALDAAFGNGGKTVVSISPGNDIASSVAVQTDGSIVAAGYTYGANGITFAMVRLTSDGEPDATFGTDGVVVTDYPGGLTVEGRAVAVLNDGKILCAGGGAGGFAVVRYNTDGSVDSTFADQGLALCAFPEQGAQANAMTVQENGNIVLTGYASGGAVDSIALARLTPLGDPDPTFGIGGKMCAASSSGAIARAMSLFPDGRIMVSGMSGPYAMLARFTAAGLLDGTFFGSGIRVLNMAGVTLSDAFGVVALPDDRTLVCGGAFTGASNDFFVARLNSDGNYDLSFDDDGYATTDFGSTALDVAHAITVQPDANIVLAGAAQGTFQDRNFALARYDGTITTGTSAPMTFHDVRVFPEPLTTGSVLDYTLVADDRVSLELYDASGSLVQELSGPQRQGAGRHQQILHIPEMSPSGSYVLALRGRATSIAVPIIVP